jgi:hypothetical protein
MEEQDNPNKKVNFGKRFADGWNGEWLSVEVDAWHPRFGDFPSER